MAFQVLGAPVTSLVSGRAWMLRRLADWPGQSPAAGNSRPGQRLAVAARADGTVGGKSGLAAHDGNYCREMMLS